MLLYFGFIIGVALVSSAPYSYHENNDLLASLDQLYDDEFDVKVGSSSQTNAKRGILRDALKTYGKENIKEWLNQNSKDADKEKILNNIAKEAIADVHGEHINDSPETKNIDPAVKKEVIRELAKELAADMKKQKDSRMSSEKDKIKQMIEDQISKRIAQKLAGKEAKQATKDGNEHEDALRDELKRKIMEKLEAKRENDPAPLLMGRRREGGKDSANNKKDLKNDEKLIMHDIAREVVADLKGERAEDSKETNSIDENRKKEVLKKLADELVKDKLKRKDQTGELKTKKEKVMELIENDIFSKIEDREAENEREDEKHLILQDLARSIGASLKGEKYTESDAVKNIDSETKKEVLHKLAKEMANDMRKRNDDNLVTLSQHDKVKRVIEDAILKRIKEKKERDQQNEDEFRDELKEKIIEKLEEKREKLDEKKREGEKLILHDLAKEVVADLKGEQSPSDDKSESVNPSLKKDVIHKLAVNIVEDMNKKKDDQYATKKDELKDLIEKDIIKRLHKDEETQEDNQRRELKEKIREKLEEKREEMEKKREADETKKVLRKLAGELMSDIRGEKVPASDETKDVDEETKKRVFHKLAQDIVADVKNRKHSDNMPTSKRDELKRVIEDDILARIKQRDVEKKQKFDFKDVQQDNKMEERRAINDEIESLLEEKRELVKDNWKN